MARYHVNPESGVPGVCTAQPGRCPFGSDNEHYSTPSDAVNAFEKRLEKQELIPTAAKKNGTTNRSPATSPATESHNSASAIPAAAIRKWQSKGVSPSIWFGRHSGRMNPHTGEGDGYGHWGNGSSVIMSKADGKRVRVVQSSGDFLHDPSGELGRPGTLVKEHSAGESETTGLYIVGYIAQDGTRYGWIPNKKIHYFVFK